LSRPSFGHTSVVLRGDDVGLGALGERRVLHDGLFGDERAGGVHAGVALEALELQRELEQALDLRVLRQFLHLRALHGLVQVDVGADGDLLGDLVDLLERHVEHAPDVAHDELGAEGAEGDDLRDAVLAVLLAHVLDDLVAAGVGEIDVQVRHGLAVRVQEALEQELVLDRVGVRDPKRVGDERARAGAAAGPDGNADGARVLDEVPDDEEVAGEAHAADHAELVVQPLRVFWARGAAQPFLQAFDAEMLQVRVLSEAVRNLELGQQKLVHRDLQVAHLGDLQRAGQRLRREAAEELVHLGGGLDVELVALELEPLRVGELAPRRDAHARVVRVVVALDGVVAVVGGDQRYARAPVELDQRRRHLPLLVDAVVHDLEVVAVGLEIVAEPRDQLLGLREIARQNRLVELGLQAAGEDDETLGMLREQFLVDARVVVVTLLERDRAELHQVLVALEVLREHGQMAVFLLGMPAIKSGPFRNIHLAAEDGLEPHRLRRRVELDRAVHIAVIRHREPFRARRRQILDRLRRPAFGIRQADHPIHERILGMVVQVYELGFIGHRGRRRLGENDPSIIRSATAPIQVLDAE